MKAPDDAGVGRLRAAAAALRLGRQASPLGLLAQLTLALLAGAAPTATAVVGKLLVDELTRGAGAGGSGRTGTIVLLAASGAALTGLLAVAGNAGTVVDAAVGRSVNLRVQDRLYQRINAFRGLGPFEDPAVQDRIRLAETASQGAPRDVLSFLMELVRSTVTIVGCLGTVLVFWPPMGLLVAASTGATLFGQLYMSRRLARSTRRTVPLTRRQVFYRMLLTDARAAKEIRLFGIGPLFHGRALRALREATGVGLATQRRGAAVQSLLALASAAVTGTAAVVVALRVWHGGVTLGDMVLFTAAVSAVQSALSAVVMQFGHADASARLFGHYLALMELPDDIPDGERTPPPLREGVVFEDVWFRYSPEGAWVLRGVDLELPHGQAVGLVGLNGAGKSTLVKLLCRLYDPQRGRILWDGTDIRELSLTELRRRIGATFQDFMTYEMTAAENIGVGTPDRLDDLDGIRRAAARADIDDTLQALPRGYGTLLSRAFKDTEENDGVLLSGGQWQRVALARSLRREEADLLILDEPSSGLDALAERRVHLALRRHREGRTSLLISHRLSALREADRIVVLADGRVAERGSHDQLVRLGGHYAELFAAQAEGYADRQEQEQEQEQSQFSRSQAVMLS